MSASRHPPSEPLSVALAIGRELDRLGIPYLVGGSVASMLHGEPRTTLDVDFAVHMSTEQARELAAHLSRDFLVQPEALIEAARRESLANVVHKRPFLKIDLHVRPRTGHHAEEMRRAVRMQVGPDAADVLRVATPEDVVLQKLRWYRLGDEVSERQWRDVVGVLKRQTALDRAYLERWSVELGVADLLQRALVDSRRG
jgi:hypothetical protein